MAKIGRGSEQAMIRLPDGMRDELKIAAAANGRSMNAEIVERLTHSLEGESSAISLDGFSTLIRRLEATVNNTEMLLFDARDINPALERYMIEQKIDRQQAICAILKDWLAEHRYLPK